MKENNSMWFTFKNGAKLLAETPLMVLASIHEMCRKSSAGCLLMIAHVDMVPNYFHFSFFLCSVFYMQWLRSGTDLITYESELHGWVSRMACSINGSPPRWVAHRYLHSDSCIFFVSCTYTLWYIYKLCNLCNLCSICPGTYVGDGSLSSHVDDNSSWAASLIDIVLLVQDANTFASLVQNASVSATEYTQTRHNMHNMQTIHNMQSIHIDRPPGL